MSKRLPNEARATRDVYIHIVTFDAAVKIHERLDHVCESFSSYIPA